MSQRRPQLDALGAVPLGVGFSPPADLAALADRLAWPWPFLSDPDRDLYGRLDLRRAPLRQVFTRATVRRYRDAAARGVEVHRPVEDARQLGADAVASGGRVAWLRRQASPDDRPRADELVAAAARFAGGR